MGDRADRRKETLNSAEVMGGIVDEGITVGMSFQDLSRCGIWFWNTAWTEVFVLTHFWHMQICNYDYKNKCKSASLRKYLNKKIFEN